MGYKEKVWHKYLRRPYALAKVVDSGSGQPVVLLHGIAANSSVWKALISRLDEKRYRVIAFDLLGFGASPYSDLPDYNVDDHARAVIESIKRAKPAVPVVLVGHSMGAVIAARVAKLRPRLIKRVILYEVPVYSDARDAGIRDIRLKAYKAFVKSLAAKPGRTLKAARRIEKLGARAISWTVTEENWPAFERSLKNTVLQEEVFEDIQASKVPVDIVYGAYDIFVPSLTMRKLFKNSERVHFYKVKQSHRISAPAGEMISGLIKNA